MPTLQSFVKQRSSCTGIQTIQDLVKEASNTSNFREKNRIKVVPKKTFQEWTAQNSLHFFEAVIRKHLKYRTFCRGEMALFVSQPARHIEEFARLPVGTKHCMWPNVLHISKAIKVSDHLYGTILGLP